MINNGFPRRSKPGEGVVDPVEHGRLQLLDHILFYFLLFDTTNLDHVPLQVQGSDRGQVAQLATTKVPEIYIVRHLSKIDNVGGARVQGESTNLMEFCARSRKARPAKLFRARGTLDSWQPCRS